MDGLMDGVNGDAVDSHDGDAGLMAGGGEDGEGQESGDGGQESGDTAPELDGQDDNHDDAEHEKLPPKVQEKVNKRIQKLDGKRKAAEERAERAEAELKGLRERVDAEDSEIVLEAARNLGVLAETLPKGAAKGMEQLRFASSAVERLQEALEDATGDEVEIEGKNYSKADVRAKLKEYRSMEKRLGSMYGGVEAQARKETLELIRLGQQAKKAGWKPGGPLPGQSTPKPKPQEKPAPGRGTPSGDDDEPASRVRGAEDGRRGADESRDDEPFSLERYYEEQEKAKKAGRK